MSQPSNQALRQLAARAKAPGRNPGQDLSTREQRRRAARKAKRSRGGGA